MSLEGLNPGGNEDQAIEPKRIPRIGGQKKVSDVGWIEGAAENPNSHGPL